MSCLLVVKVSIGGKATPEAIKAALLQKVSRGKYKGCLLRLDSRVHSRRDGRPRFCCGRFGVLLDRTNWSLVVSDGYRLRKQEGRHLLKYRRSNPFRYIFRNFPISPGKRVSVLFLVFSGIPAR